jgi:Xaa-Pro aminopeptidase
MPAVPAAEVESRRARLRRAMRRAGVGAVYLTGEPSVHYYSGFTGSESALLLTASTACLFTDFRYREEAEASLRDCEVAIWQGGRAASAGARARSLGVKTIGYEEDDLRVGEHEALRRAAQGSRTRAWSAAIKAPRRSKSAWELRAIRRALRAAEAAFGELRGILAPGMREREVALELEYRLRRHGASGPAFATIAAVAGNAARPHAHAEDRRIREGSLLLIDWGARLGAYNSDLTRTLFAGSIPARWRRRYEQVLEAQLQAIKNITAAKSGAEIDATARQCLAGHGLGERFGHALGHGVGLEVHEGPSLSRRNRDPLPAGAVVTVEPGVYFPRRGGIRIEDMVCVTGDGAKVLSRVPKSLSAAVF